MVCAGRYDSILTGAVVLGDLPFAPESSRILKVRAAAAQKGLFDLPPEGPPGKGIVYLVSAISAWRDRGLQMKRALGYISAASQ